MEIESSAQLPLYKQNAFDNAQKIHKSRCLSFLKASYSHSKTSLCQSSQSSIWNRAKPSKSRKIGLKQFCLKMDQLHNKATHWSRTPKLTFCDAPLNNPLSQIALLPVGSSSTSSDTSLGSLTYQKCMHEHS